MEALMEAIAEHIEDALRINKAYIAKGILLDVEEWYQEHIEKIEKPKDLLRDPVFSAVYMYGYENVNWYEVCATLEVEYYDRIHDMLYEREPEPEEEENEESEDEKEDE